MKTASLSLWGERTWSCTRWPVLACKARRTASSLWPHGPLTRAGSGVWMERVTRAGARVCRRVEGDGARARSRARRWRAWTLRHDRLDTCLQWSMRRFRGMADRQCCPSTRADGLIGVSGSRFSSHRPRHVCVKLIVARCHLYLLWDAHDRAVLWRRRSFGTQSAEGSVFVARLLDRRHDAAPTGARRA